MQRKFKLISFYTSNGASTLVDTFKGTINGLSVAAVSEPETYSMLVTGLDLIGLAARRRNKNA